MKKNKIIAFWRRQDWEGFLMGFISVVLGIVITFGGEAWISSNREKNNVKDVLILVRDELNSNIEVMDDINDNLQLENRAALYLMQYYDNFEACSMDSMRLYCNAPLTTLSSKPSQDALELLKTSALLPKVKDKSLMLDIIKAYNQLQIEQDNINFYFSKKEKLIDRAMQEEAKALFARQHFTPAEMWTAITSTDEGRHFLHEISISVAFGFGHEETKQYLQQIVAKLDEYIAEQ